MGLLRFHRSWWPVFIFAAVLVVMDIIVLVVMTVALQHPERFTGREPRWGWWGFAALLMLEPVVALAPLTYITAKQIEKERAARQARIEEVAAEAARPRAVDVVPEDAERSETWRRGLEARAEQRRASSDRDVDGTPETS